MIGTLEIILSIIVFCIIWFVIFKLKLIYDEKKIRKNINKKIDNQKNKEFIIDGKKVKLSKEIQSKELQIDEIKTKSPGEIEGETEVNKEGTTI